MTTISSPSFVVELPLGVGSDVEKFLERTFEYGRSLHNATLGTVLGRAQRLRETKEWRNARAMPAGPERSRRFRELRKEAGLDQNGVEKILKAHQEGSNRKDQLTSNEAQKIADRMARALDRWFFGLGGRPKFKSKSRGLHSIEGKTNKSGIVWKSGSQTVVWMKRAMKAYVDRSDAWLMQALADPADPAEPRKVKYCRILRRCISGRKRWYAQLICEGVPPVKHIYAPTERKAAVDPSTKSITVACEDGTAEKIDISGELKKDRREVRRLQRALDRSRRATNPDNYNKDGTVKKGPQLWRKSKHYLGLAAELADAHRRAAAHRKCVHGEVVNRVLEHAGTVKVEKNNFKAFQRSGCGRSLGLGGPSGVFSSMKRKAESAGLKYVEIDPRVLKPSQHDLETGEYVKHDRSERWIQLGRSGLWINRDVMAALNLLWSDSDQGYPPPEVLRERWEAAKQALLDAGWVVEKEASCEEPDLRRFHRKDRKALTVKELRRKQRREHECDGTSAQARVQSRASTGVTPVNAGETPRVHTGGV